MTLPLPTQAPIWIGNTIRADVTFGAVVGVPTPNANEVTITARRPDGTTQQGAVQNGTEDGAFYADFVADQAGVWHVRAECAGLLSAAEEGRFTVKPSMVLGS
jgi:hypothetical protein